jgi:glucosamine-6-phosphate deaminase
MAIEILVVEDFERMSAVAAELAERRIAEFQRERSGVVLGLATGGSPTGLYQRLAAAANEGRVDSARWRTFNLDEYVGLPGENAAERTLHPESYAWFMIEHFFGLLSRKPASMSVPWGTLIDQGRLREELEGHPEDWEYRGAATGKAIVIRPEASSSHLAWVRGEVLEAYARRIESAGGVDLQILGVGGRGHVAFHESGIPFDLPGLLLVELDRVTREHAVADGHFPSLEDCPRYAVTMSLRLVFQARSALLLANGSRKTRAVARSLLDAPSEDVPLSYVQTYAEAGGQLTMVLDGEAAAELPARRSELESRGYVLQDLRTA